ncbi:MAG: hypothetical protein FMNOHCHN_03723 [Ignavibacteriaceae bacterium]|nr:hypothetical protein [Ignavibacteriaceae bacterium]
MSKVQVKIRPASQEDVPFIFASWLKSYRDSFLVRDVGNEVYYNGHHKVIERLLQRGTSLIACASDDPSQIYGYLVYETISNITVFHFGYTKHSYRRLGILKALIEATGHNLELGSCYTHQTRIGAKIAEKHKSVYHPYIFINDVKE